MSKTKYNLDTYDCEKLQEARNIVYGIYEYNYSEWSPLSKRLETILNKIDYLIDSYYSK